MSDAKLSGRTAIVTGGGGAIGGAIARLFAAEGAAVLVADVRPDAALEVSNAIGEAGGRAAAWETDVSDPGSCKQAVDAALSEFGALHVLVNVAAAVSPDASVVDLDIADWNEAFAVNLTGPFLMCKHAIPPIKAAGGGAIVNIASQLGTMGVPLRSAYCTTKAALIHLTRILAMENAADNIRVNSISPGVIHTPRIMRRWKSVADMQQNRGPTHLLGRVGKPEEVARAALYLASDDSSFTTATDLLVDGGYVAFKGTTDRMSG
jgi:NAD(P)-dependent dehydrogenase (short-subunit alcohol dehydrogenase family)